MNRRPRSALVGSLAATIALSIAPIGAQAAPSLTPDKAPATPWEDPAAAGDADYQYVDNRPGPTEKAAGKAADKAAGKAAKNAADKAADTAATRAAQRAAQKAADEAAQQAAGKPTPTAPVRLNRFGTPEKLTGKLAQGLSTDPETTARRYLARNRSLFGTTATADDLETVAVTPIGKGSVVLLRQRFGGLPAAPDGLVAVAVKQGDVLQVTSSLSPQTAKPAAAPSRPPTR